MRTALFALAGVLAAATAADAQTPAFRPVDTNKLIVRPVDQATGFLSSATRTLSRVVAQSIEADGITRTVNALFGRERTVAPIMSNGINPAAYPTYQSPLFHVQPTSSVYRR